MQNAKCRVKNALLLIPNSAFCTLDFELSSLLLRGHPFFCSALLNAPRRHRFCAILGLASQLE